MSKDPEKSELEGQDAANGVYEPQRRSRVREIILRATLILAALLGLRIIQVYRAQSVRHARLHHHRPGVGHRPWHGGSQEHWHEKPQPRLSMDEREKLFLWAFICRIQTVKSDLIQVHTKCRERAGNLLGIHQTRAPRRLCARSRGCTPHAEILPGRVADPCA